MIQTFLLLIPVFTALYGILIHLLFAPKSRTCLTAVMFLFVMTLYLFTVQSGDEYSAYRADKITADAAGRNTEIGTDCCSD